jgi:hypothetical protein
MSLEERDVWDCLIPAAIRDDIDLPQRRKLKMSSGSYRRFKPDYDDASTLKTDDDTSYDRTVVAYAKPEIDGNYFWTSILTLCDAYYAKDLKPLPPKVFFQMHDIPKAPTWSERDVDNHWLPASPSLAYDEYSIGEEY